MMERIVERKRREDPEYRKQLEANRKASRSQGRAMSDEELLEKLRCFGLELDRATLGEWCRQARSAQELSLDLRRTRPLKLSAMDEDWLWIYLLVLWERWFPDLPSFEMIDDTMQAGYDALDEGEAQACEMWLRTWNDILTMIRLDKVRDLDDFDEEFGGLQCLFNWIQDFTMHLWNAGVHEPRFLRERVAVCEEALGRWPGADCHLTESLRADMAEASFRLGATEQANAQFKQWLDDDPQWGWGWIHWSDCYAREFMGNRDPERAKAILRRGLAAPGVRDRRDLLERLAEIHEEAGEDEEAAQVRAESERPNTPSVRTVVSRVGNVLRQKTTFNFGEEGLPMDEFEEFHRALIAQRSGREMPMHQVGRNAPCPCGSGKKYKKCCGRPRAGQK